MGGIRDSPRMEESSGYFLDKAEECRRLARTGRDDLVRQALLDRAAEFEARAIEAAIRESNAFYIANGGRHDERIIPRLNSG
jgi:hypothetical protein